MTPEQLAFVMQCPLERARRWLPHILEAMALGQANTPTRQVDFLAQIGHESGGLQFTTELWGPTPAQLKYEGRADLGNTQPGDGARFQGHGLIQVTGRANHAAARDRLRALLPTEDVPDFEAAPGQLAMPRWAALSAGEFWLRNGCNALSDANDFVRLTRRINGGENGLADRERRRSLAQVALL